MEASKNQGVRQSIPGALAEKWGAAAFPRLVELLEDSDQGVRDSAAQALGTLKDKRAIDFLIHRLGNQQDGWDAARALGDIGDPKAIPALRKAMKDEHVENDVHIAAAGALARMGQGDGLSYLLAMLKTPNRVDQMGAAQESRMSQIKGTLDALLSLLTDRDEYVRAAAVEAVGELHDTRATLPVTKLLNDHDFRTRAAAVKALGEIRDPLAIPALRKLLKDPDPFFRQDVARVLKRLGDKPPPASQPGRP
jgi:HEAT repeat protein